MSELKINREALIVNRGHLKFMNPPSIRKTLSPLPPSACVPGQARIHPEGKAHPPKSRFLPSKWERMKASGGGDQKHSRRVLESVVFFLSQPAHT